MVKLLLSYAGVQPVDVISNWEWKDIEQRVKDVQAGKNQDK